MDAATVGIRLVPPDALRARFSRALSDMYRAEVPAYGTLLRLVAETNEAARATTADSPDRVAGERHGAIRLGTPGELATIRRVFAVFGMVPVGYYDLAPAGVPVHSTAFRPVSADALAQNPFRVFTSLLRLDLVADPALRDEAGAILARRRIFSPALLALLDRAEAEGGVPTADADPFIAEALEIFRWRGEATVPADTYRRLLATHPLIADVVCFPNPHINHLTPRTLDIDAVQRLMPAAGIEPKAVIEGPPPRACPILLRQTSFRALTEPVTFPGGGEAGAHTARFGEVEQRGLALTRAGRARYDALLANAGGPGPDYPARLAAAFAAFPDNAEALRRDRLGFFRYARAPGAAPPAPGASLDGLVAAGEVMAAPITYEDFLPVSAAGIFRSNLGAHEPDRLAADGDRAAFVEALGAEPLDEFTLYEAIEQASIEALHGR